MKLSRVLKLRVKLVAEIAQLKKVINSKNSFVVGTDVSKFNVEAKVEELIKKTYDLIDLKCKINDANNGIVGTTVDANSIAHQIIRLGEIKSLIKFFDDLNTKEGVEVPRYGGGEATYDAVIDEIEAKKKRDAFQDMADAIQDEIDEFNHSVEVDID